MVKELLCCFVLVSSVMASQSSITCGYLLLQLAVDVLVVMFLIA